MQVLVKRMYEKDEALANELGCYSIPVAIQKWRDKYPEDFATLLNTDRPSVLDDKAEEFVILPSSETTSRRIAGGWHDESS